MPARQQGGGSTGQACAACKYQRRRCTAGCRLARYFPHDRPRLFRNAHRLFGVSNILRTLDRVGPDRSNDAMRAIAFEADAWDMYPAHGCVAIIAALLHQLHRDEAQLHQLNARLHTCRNIAQALPPSSSMLAPPPPMENNNNIMYHHHQLYHDNNDDIAASLLWTTQPQYDSSNAVDTAVGVPQDQDHYHILLDTTTGDQLSIQQEYDDISPFLEDIDDDDEIPFESSSADSSEKKAIKSSTMDGANELKDAAACFTLTSAVNQ